MVVILNDIPQAPMRFSDRFEDYEQSKAQYLAALAHLRSFEPKDAIRALVSSVLAFLRRLPSTENPMWHVPASQIVPVGQTIVDMVMPFYNTGPYGVVVRKRYEQGARIAAQKTNTKEDMLWPQHYDGADILNLFLLPEYQAMFTTAVPYNPFPDEMRFTHHWCLGDNGSGKTTYLRHFIKHDLERVAAGECSLIVIDSKKLIREMRTLKHFGPEGALHGKLILIDPEHPFPLNPFRLPKNEAVDVLTYMLGSVASATELQGGALEYIISAAYDVPDANLDTVRDFFLPPPKGEKNYLPHAEHFAKFDEDTQFWLKNVFPSIPTPTRQGILQRLMNFRSNALLRDMFCAETCELDLFRDLNEGGKVLLVDTDLGTLTKSRTELLGRLIIAFIDQLSGKRTRLPEKSLKPVFVYIDEAHDYIKADPRFADILEKARAQRIGMTVAHHHRGQIDLRIQQSLENAGIRSQCVDKGLPVEVKTRRAEFTIPVSQLEFDGDAMAPAEYAAMRDRLRKKYRFRALPRKDGSDFNVEADAE